MSQPPVTPDPWSEWRQHTPARIALGRAGNGTPTTETLHFGAAHAMARDAIHAPLDSEALIKGLHDDGWNTFCVHSQAPDRLTYLRRPDLGRRLLEQDVSRLAAERGQGVDISLSIGDGLSSLAVQSHALPLLRALRAELGGAFTLAPIVVAEQARVALADEVGAALGTRLAVILIGERPGLSSPDSLGIYLTHSPKVGRHDAERNCISNVRPEGLGYEAAAFKLAWLIRQSLRLGLSGVKLKDESDLATLEANSAKPLPGQ